MLGRLQRSNGCRRLWLVATAAAAHLVCGRVVGSADELLRGEALLQHGVFGMGGPVTGLALQEMSAGARAMDARGNSAEFSHVRLV